MFTNEEEENKEKKRQELIKKINEDPEAFYQAFRKLYQRGHIKLKIKK